MPLLWDGAGRGGSSGLVPQRSFRPLQARGNDGLIRWTRLGPSLATLGRSPRGHRAWGRQSFRLVRARAHRRRRAGPGYRKQEARRRLLRLGRLAAQARARRRGGQRRSLHPILCSLRPTHPRHESGVERPHGRRLVSRMAQPPQGLDGPERLFFAAFGALLLALAFLLAVAFAIALAIRGGILSGALKLADLLFLDGGLALVDALFFLGRLGRRLRIGGHFHLDLGFVGALLQARLAASFGIDLPLAGPQATRAALAHRLVSAAGAPLAGLRGLSLSGADASFGANLSLCLGLTRKEPFDGRLQLSRALTSARVHSLLLRLCPLGRSIRPVGLGGWSIRRVRKVGNPVVATGGSTLGPATTRGRCRWRGRLGRRGGRDAGLWLLGLRRATGFGGLTRNRHGGPLPAPGEPGSHGMDRPGSDGLRPRRQPCALPPSGR